MPKYFFMKYKITVFIVFLGLTLHSQTPQDSLPKGTTQLDEIVVSGTLKPVKRLENAVPVEIITSTFLKQNPTSNLVDALQNANGLRPQNNCNVCNTFDIRINGMEGAYTMVTIDGMPIVSALGTVYGLSGIPTSMIERIEVVKGPASSLYGSEAVAGLLNIITKKPENHKRFTGNFFTTSWWEHNVDLGYRLGSKKSGNGLLGVNYVHAQNRVDENRDNFTDVALQHRIALFGKWNFKRKSGKAFQWVSRYLYEDRWGGQMQWNSSFRGGDQVYGESIYTSRYEFLGLYELPTTEKIKLQYSWIGHNQNSVYGNSVYIAQQNIGFVQALWDKQIGNHSLLTGSAYRYQFYNDNTPATAQSNHMHIGSFFVQDDWTWSAKTGALLGMRYDYNSAHGSILTPRIAFKWKPASNAVMRFNLGTGFRVVNLFTEDHQALSGARDVILAESLRPETSYNANWNYLHKWSTTEAGTFVIEASTWLTYFTNRILPDYDTNPNAIIYKNLDGDMRMWGSGLQGDWISPFGITASLGFNLYRPTVRQEGREFQPLFAERYGANWSIAFTPRNSKWTLDYTGNLTGPMRLPLLGPLDPRREYSLPFSIQNIQLTYKGGHHFEIYGGVKNLLNWTPNRGNPFLIARANDPFDQNVQFDSNGMALPTPDNPFGLTFDPTYAYGPNQGIRGFIGIRFHWD